MRKILLLICLMFSLAALSKTTYIPSYYSQINVVGDDGTIADSTIRREFFLMAKDGRYAITIMHDSVTQERVSAIKHEKAIAGWSAFSMILSGVSTVLNSTRTKFDLLKYSNEIGNMYSSGMQMVSAATKASEMQRVSVSVLIENFSDKEMVINDMKRGLTWYVPAKSYMDFSVGNPEVNKFRIAFTDKPDYKDYVTIQAANHLKKLDVALETKDYWIFPHETYVYRAATQESVLKIDHYEIKDKVTFERKNITIEEFKKLKKESVDN